MTQFSETIVPPVYVNPGNTARVLVVDDEQYMCEICARTLGAASYNVVATTDTKAALHELRHNQPFDLLLVDIKMPTMSGLDLARTAREGDPAIAIIIMTGHASIENLHQAVQRGIADFITKPFELEQLQLAVEQALHKRRLLQDSLRLQSVEQLLASSDAINATLHRAELCQIILQTALKQTDCQVGFLLLGDDQHNFCETLSAPAKWQLLDAGYAIARQVRQNGAPLNVRGEEVLCSDGAKHISRILAVPLRAQGNIIGVLLLGDDRPDALRPGMQEIATILANHAGTALRNAHLYGELQEAYQRLQELDRLKSEFIAIASHELRTPLSIVLGYATMVRDQSSGNQREYAERVVTSAQKINDIVNDMVNLRHLELGKATINLERCELQHLISQVMAQMLPVAQQKGHEVTLTLPPKPVLILTDREKVILVLSNLLSNAIKFTPKHGAIEIKAFLWSRDRPENISPNAVVFSSPVRPEPANTNASWIALMVQDNGIGIPERELARIFERFYQVADSLTRQQDGAGLGLTIVRELVLLLGGTIWVESTIGQGSVFGFALPYRPT
jgi:signal transduction histidine kinase/CheY-like chemotaxis protein